MQLNKVEYSKMEALRIELKSLAIKNAMENARALTTPLNQKTGKALHIIDVSNYAVNSSRMLGEVVVRGYAAQAKSAPIEIEFEKIKVNAAVNVKFSLY